MIAGCIILGAILFSIAASAMKWFPLFARHVRIGLRLAAGLDSQYLRPRRGARVIPFPVGRTVAR